MQCRAVVDTATAHPQLPPRPSTIDTGVRRQTHRHQSSVEDDASCGGGWIQGYNRQAAASPNLIARRGRIDPDPNVDNEIGVLLANAGYLTDTNFTASPGLDRSIAIGNSAAVSTAAKDRPVYWLPPVRHREKRCRTGYAPRLAATGQHGDMTDVTISSSRNWLPCVLNPSSVPSNGNDRYRLV